MAEYQCLPLVAHFSYEPGAASVVHWHVRDSAHLIDSEESQRQTPSHEINDTFALGIRSVPGSKSCAGSCVRVYQGRKRDEV
jgi:hypothetical protein